MPDSVPSLRLPTSDGIMALVNTVASSAPMVARPKEISTSGASPISPGIANHSPHSPTKSSTEKAAIHGLRRVPSSAMAPSTGASAAAINSAMPVAYAHSEEPRAGLSIKPFTKYGANRKVTTRV